MANKRSTRKRNGKKRAVKVKIENQPAQPETLEFSDDSGTSEDSFFPTPQSPAKETDWCPDPKLRKGINKFFAALQSATGKVCRFMPSDLSPGEDPLRREYQNLAEIKNSAEKIICEYINTNNEGMDALDAKLKHQASLVKSASRASENHQQLRISNSRFDLMDVDANTSSDREDADPESKYNDLAGNSLLAKQVLKESSMIEAEMQSLNRRIASKERQLQAMSEELRKMRETLNVQAGQKEVINDNNAIQSDGSYKGNNELERGVDAMDNETYLSQLLQDQCNLRNIAPGKFKYLQQILDKEIASVSLKVNQEKIDVENVEKTNKNKITSLTEIIMVPVDEYPTYNFVGRILGPRGMTVRQLEEQTGCKIMVRGRGSIKGKIRDRGSEDEPLHVQIQCEDYPDRVKEKMKRAVDRVNELLTPPPDGKDELKRKQLVELAIINGTYRPTNATKNALQTPSPFDAGHLTSRLDYPMMSPPRTNQLPDGDLLQKLQLLQLLSCNNPSITDYLLRCSMPGSPMFSNPLLSPAQSPSNNFSNIGGVHQASFQEYLDAAALVNSVPTFTHDGSGDCPKK